MDDGGAHGAQVPPEGGHDRSQVEDQAEPEDVVVNGLDGAAAHADQRLQAVEPPIPDQHHTRRGGGDIGPRIPHGDAHVGGGQGRRIVDAVSHHGHPEALELEILQVGQLLLREQPGVHLGNPDLPGHPKGRLFVVSRQEQGLPDPQLAQLGHRPVRLLPGLILQEEDSRGLLFPPDQDGDASLGRGLIQDFLLRLGEGDSLLFQESRAADQYGRSRIIAGCRHRPLQTQSRMPLDRLPG